MGGKASHLNKRTLRLFSQKDWRDTKTDLGSSPDCASFYVNDHGTVFTFYDLSFLICKKNKGIGKERIILVANKELS